jgi:putative glycosyltransferase (TIGR04372 family)
VDNIQAPDSRTAAYLWLGTLPERIADDIDTPALFVRILKVAEESLRTLIDIMPSYAEAHRALGRNLWLQGRIDEAFLQFKHVEHNHDEIPVSKTHVKCTGLTNYPDLLIKTKILTGDERSYLLAVSKDAVLNQGFFDSNGAFFDYLKPYLKLDFSSEIGKPKQNSADLQHAARDALSIQQQWDCEERGSLLTLREDHRQLLQKHKAIWGIKEDDWFVCLETQSVGDGRYNPQDFKFTPIEDYYEAIKKVIDAGGWVIRMGDPSMVKLELDAIDTDKSKIIDYAHYADRSADLEVALCASCHLFVSAWSKLRIVAHAFERPVCSINCSLSGDVAWHPKEVFLPMLYYSLYDHRIMALEEILASESAYQFHKQYLTHERIALLRNTPDEIANTILEALQQNRKTGDIQNDFVHINQKYNRGVYSQIGRYFTEKHRDKLFPRTHQEVQKAHVA